MPKNSIWKFPLKTTDYQEVSMPKGAQILSIQVQNEVPCIWAVVDDNADKEVRIFEIYGTGNGYSDLKWFGKEHSFIGTYQLYNGDLVFHCFELKDI